MFGPGIPHLFPLGLIALIILYTVERYSVAYYYRMPVDFNDSLNTDCIGDILWSPIVYCVMGFWFFSNRQIFENFVIPLEYLNDVPHMGHTIIGSLTRISPGTPFFIMFVLALIGQFFNFIDHYFVSLWDGSVNLKNISEQETLERGKTH